MTVSQSNAEGATLDAQEHPEPPTRTVERRPGRPGRKAVTDGQVDIFGVVIEVQEPERKHRSVWSEPVPEPLSETDDLDAVAEAAAEVVASDLDAELAALDPEAGMHLWAKMTRAAIAAAGELSHAEFRVLVIHLATIAKADEHNQPLWRLAEQYGISRVATMSEATSELVKKGWLHRRDRGWEAAGKRRPFGYRPTQRLVDLVEKAGPIRSADGSTDAETEPATRVRSAYGGTRVRSADALVAEAFTTTTESEPYEADGAACVDCGGPVTTAPNGTPNPRCKPCHTAGKRSHQRSQPRAEGEPPPPPPVRGSGIGPDCNECGRDADTLDDRGHARWCSALEIEPKTPEMASQDAHRALVSTSSDDEAVNRLKAARDALRASVEIEG